MTANHLPLLETEAMCNHAQEPLQLLTGKATEKQQGNDVTLEKRTPNLQVINVGPYAILINRMH